MVSYPPNQIDNYSNDNHFNHFKKRTTDRFHKMKNQIVEKNYKF